MQVANPSTGKGKGQQFKVILGSRMSWKPSQTKFEILSQNKLYIAFIKYTFHIKYTRNILKLEETLL